MVPFCIQKIREVPPPLIVKFATPKPLMLTWLVITKKGLMTVMVDPLDTVKLIWWGAAAVAVASALAFRMACRKEPVPLSLVLLTVKIVAWETPNTLTKIKKIKKMFFIKYIFLSPTLFLSPSNLPVCQHSKPSRNTSPSVIHSPQTPLDAC